MPDRTASCKGYVSICVSECMCVCVCVYGGVCMYMCGWVHLGDVRYVFLYIHN